MDMPVLQKEKRKKRDLKWDIKNQLIWVVFQTAGHDQNQFNEL